jgi:Zn-dependent protease with chaperone function
MNTQTNATMNANSNPHGIAAQWFDGKTARRISVTLNISGRTVAVMDGESNTLAHVPKDLVRVSERIASTPYRLEFPDGGLAVTSDHAAIEREFKLDPGAHWLAKMEAAAWAVVVAIVGLFAALYFAYQYAIPKVAGAVAERIPREAEASIGQATMAGLDRWMFKPTETDEATQRAIRAEFDRLASASNMRDVVTLEFRKMAPNALAIPGGTIVVTDGLVRLFQKDTRLIGAVLAHEIGHIYHRHSLKHLLAGSASALIVGAIAGDVSGVSALVTSAPVILSSLAYTRESEAEADRYAFDLLKKVGRSPVDFADAMRRLQMMEDCMALRSSHLKSYGASSRSDSADVETAEDEDAESGAKSPSPEQARRMVCIDDPESVTRGREADIEKLRKESDDRETGYMHTHPINAERIRAAEAAAKQ